MTLKRRSLRFFQESVSDRPKIRADLDPFHVRNRKGQFYYGFNDPFDLADEQILIPHDLFYLLQFFDGEHRLDDLKVKYKRKFNRALEIERLQRLVKKLDTTYLLENNRFANALQQARAEFHNKNVRESCCAGSSYPDQPEELRNELNHLADIVPALPKLEKHLSTHRIKAMIVPHVDPNLGGESYAQAYRLLSMTPPVDLYIILGIGHSTVENNFVLTKKMFKTPLGQLETDQQFADKIAEYCPFDVFHDELAHRNEHSIEFQTVFLSHFINTPFKILPVLCSLAPDCKADEQQRFESFVAALKNALDNFSGSYCLIASVDLAHVGLKYGHDFRPDPAYLAQVEQNDRQLLHYMSKQDRKAFTGFFQRSQNKYNICGYAALRTLLEILPPLKGYLLDYNNAIMDDDRSTVTFSGMIYI